MDRVLLRPRSRSEEQMNSLRPSSTEVDPANAPHADRNIFSGKLRGFVVAVDALMRAHVCQNATRLPALDQRELQTNANCDPWDAHAMICVMGRP